MNGLYGFDNNFLLDGVDNNEFGEGTIAVQPSPDALQTFSIEESSMKAEFGRGGAAVNAVLKSGTNASHGGAFEYFRNSALDAANYFATTGKPPFKRNQFAVSSAAPSSRTAPSSLEITRERATTKGLPTSAQSPRKRSTTEISPPWASTSTIRIQPRATDRAH